MLDPMSLSGIVPPLATPLTDDERLDEAGLRRLVDYVLKGGVGALFVMGSTGEFACLPADTRRRAIEVVVEQTAGRVPVLAGCSDAATAMSVARARDAQAVGADALVATLPYYFKPSPAEMVVHMRAIAEATDLPLILYNIPSTTKGFLAADTVVELSDHPKIIGVKDSSEDFNNFQKLLAAFRDRPDFRVFQGSEAQAGVSLLWGANGAVLGIANLLPELCVALYNAARAGNIAETIRLQRDISFADRIRFHPGSSPLGGLKAGLELVGVCGPRLTSPIPLVTDSARQAIRADLDALRKWLG
jgi:4-hydroxy-tetrahydrodipicolinate synthase